MDFNVRTFTTMVTVILVTGCAPAALARSTSCSDVVSAFDREDRDAALRYDREIRTIMESIDEDYVEKGRRSVIKPLSDNGYLKIRMVAVENCRAHPDQTLIRSARDMYDGVRSMQDTILGK